MIDSFTEVSHFRCLTRFQDLLKGTNNKSLVVCFEKQERNKTMKNWDAKHFFIKQNEKKKKRDKKEKIKSLNENNYSI